MGMLVLTRRPGEKIRIGEEIEITVLELDGARVRLGFVAPPELAVHRLEVWHRIHAAAAAGAFAGPAEPKRQPRPSSGRSSRRKRA